MSARFQVTVNSKNNSIRIFMGDENDNFQNKNIYSTGDHSHPYAISIGDFNNDNRIDFIIANERTDSIGIFIGFSYTTFQSRNTYSDENNKEPNAVVVNHFNNDNYVDIAVVFSYTNNLSILLGYENQSFATMITYSTGVRSIPLCLAVADFINDNRTDIVSTNSGTHNIGIFLVYGNGSFGIMMKYSTGYHSHTDGVAAGDFNNDCRLDIVVANFGTSSIGIFLGYGDGNFSSQVIYSTGYQSWPRWVVIDDLNNDNQTDIATANFNTNNVGIFLEYGNGSFATMVPYSSRDGSVPLSLSVGDFNNDNILDVAVGNYGTKNVVVLSGFGDGTLLLGSPCSNHTALLPMSIAYAQSPN